MKERNYKIVAGFWFVASICFLIAGVMQHNYFNIILAFADVAIGFSYISMMKKNQDNNQENSEGNEDKH